MVYGCILNMSVDSWVVSRLFFLFFSLHFYTMTNSATVVFHEFVFSSTLYVKKLPWGVTPQEQIVEVHLFRHCQIVLQSYFGN